MKNTIVTVEVDGVDVSLVCVNGALRVAADGVDVGPVRGRKRLAGPQLAASMAGSKAVYKRFACSPAYRAYLGSSIAG